jgi:hypothetical protein
VASTPLEQIPLLNPLPEDEESGTNKFAVWDASRNQLYSMTMSRVGGSGSGVDVEDDGEAVATATTINFVNATSVVDDTGTVTVTLPTGGSGVDVEDEGVAVATATVLNFVNATSVTDDAGTVTVTLPVGGGGGDVLNIGVVAPTTEGNDGEYYYDIENFNNYGPKTAGSWGSPISNTKGESWFGTKQTVAISSGEVAVDYTDGRLVDVTVGANITDFVFTNWPADGTPGSVTFRFTLSGTRTIAWAALGTAIRAEGGVVPAIPDSGATLIVTIYSADALATVDIFVGASSMETVA